MCLTVSYVQDLAARNIVVDENLVCKISAIDRCEDLNTSGPPARVHFTFFLYAYTYFLYWVISSSFEHWLPS